MKVCFSSQGHPQFSKPDPRYHGAKGEIIS